MRIFNIPELKQRRKLLRKKQTLEEAKIWEKLRNKRLHNFKFYRQYSIGYYIVDFYCPQIKLVIEIDGKFHDSEYNQDYDKIRSNYFESIGIKTIRFPNQKVLKDIDSVMKDVTRFINILFPSCMKRG